jgi:RNA-directed DNA polymerase
MTPKKGDTCNGTFLIENWSEIDWPKINKEVKRLRSRVYQAKLDNNIRKLRCLQRLVLKSSSNILFSIREISKNPGCKTPGVDGFRLSDSRDKLKLFYEIKERGYMGKDPCPTRRIYIKEPTKLRPIGIPTVYDRIIQCMVKNSLEPEWEAVFEGGSYGFRPMRNVDDVVHRLWVSLNKQTSRKWIVDSDISKCFDSISHNYILGKVGGFPRPQHYKKMA